MRITMALLGSWDWHDNTDQTGITVCEYEESGKLKVIENYYPDVKVGSPVVISMKEVLYFVHESKHTDDMRNEGGYVYAAQLKGKEIIPLNRKKTYSPNPCYCVIDQKQEYLIVVHHASSRSIATKIYRDDEGNVRSKIIYDDAVVELFKLEEDGSLGEIVDYAFHEPIGTKMSLLHGVYRIPDSDIFIVTDKGLDRLYSYKINYETAKLELLDTLELCDYAHPKYIAIAQKNNMLYCCYEKKLTIAMVQYDDYTGKLQSLGEFPLQIQHLDICGSQDILVSPDERTMYVVIMGEDREGKEKDKNNGLYHIMNTPSYIATYDISVQLNPILKQCLSTEGKGARSIAMTPDNKFILVFNTDSSEMSKFKIDENGLLTCVEVINIPHPECVTFFEI